MNCNGCTKCCQAIMLPKATPLRTGGGPDLEFIRQNWKPLKLRQAKKRNPYMFEGCLKDLRKRSRFFSCTQLTATGCAAYERRPPVCSGYPFYGSPGELRLAQGYVPNEYSEDCVYIIGDL